MKAREQLVSTFMGNALAIPHGTDEAKNEVLTSGLSLIQIPDGLDWNGEEVKVVIGIAGKMANILTSFLKLRLLLVKKKTLKKLFMQKMVLRFDVSLRRRMHNESFTF